MKVLCIHATAGAGHQKAAEAVCEALRGHGHDVTIIDSLDYTSPAFKKSYKGGYAFLISKVPFVWAFFFKLADISWFQWLMRWIRKVYNHLNARNLEKFLIDQKFDAVISAHFLSTEAVSRLKREGKIASKLITVVTDFDVHHFWLGSHVDAYAVASPFTKLRLEFFGVDSEKIHVTGIPTGKAFGQPMDKQALRRKLGLNPEEFTVLMATGSFGIGPIREIVDQLDGFQVAVVCGHNKNLYESLSRSVKSNVKVFGLVNNMHEMMAAADAMLTKPGGLSTSEALVRRLPMVFFSAIPGQEQGNVHVLGTYGIGLMPSSIEGIVQALEYWRDHPDEYQAQRSRMDVIARPNAAVDIVKLVEQN